MEKPCGEECADENSVFHNGVAQPKRFGVLEHPLQRFDDIRRIKLLKAVVDVALAAILRALHIVLHPLLQCLDAVGVPSAGDACDAVPVHAPHNVRDHRLHNSVVNSCEATRRKNIPDETSSSLQRDHIGRKPSSGNSGSERRPSAKRQSQPEQKGH